MISKRIQASVFHTFYTLKKFAVIWLVSLGFILWFYLNAFLNDINLSGVYLSVIFLSSAIAIPAIWFATSSYGYLNSRKEMDFYHSQPVKRSVLFWTKYIVGLAAIILPLSAIYLISIGLEWISSINESFFNETPFSRIIIAICFIFGAVLCIYNLCVFARMICGNSVVAFIFAAFLTILPAAVMFLMGTIIDRHAQFLPKILTDIAQIFRLTPYNMLFISPINYMNNPNNVSKADTVAFILQIAITLGLVVFASFLYKKRKSEHGGKPIVFKSALIIIKCLIITVVALFGGALFFEFSGGNFKWEIAGYIIIGLLAFAIINVVEEYDIKNVFRHGIQLVVMSLIFSVTVTGTYIYAKQADVYLPSLDEIKSIQITQYEYTKPITDRETIKQLYKIAVDCVDGALTDTDRYYNTLPYTITTKSGKKVIRNYPVYSGEDYAALMKNEIFFESSDVFGALTREHINKFQFGHVTFDYNEGYYTYSAELDGYEAVKFLKDNFDHFKELSFKKINNEITLDKEKDINIYMQFQKDSYWNNSIYTDIFLSPDDKLYDELLKYIKENGYRYENIIIDNDYEKKRID